MTDTVKAWIEERRAIHAKATPGEWEEDAASGLGGCVYLADGSYECVADAMSTDDAGPIVDAHNTFPRALDALNKVLELHVKGYETAGASWCLECETRWPCDTYRAIESALEAGE